MPGQKACFACVGSTAFIAVLLIAPVSEARAAEAKENLDDKTCGGIATVGEDIFSHQHVVKYSSTFLDSLADWIDANCKAPYNVQWAIEADRTTFNLFARQLQIGQPKDRVYLDRFGVRLALEPSHSPYSLRAFLPAASTSDNLAQNNELDTEHANSALKLPLNRMGLTTSNFPDSPLGKMAFGKDRGHLQYSTIDQLRSYDRHFTGENIRDAADETKRLGSSVNDLPAMRDQATIQRYDKDAKKNNARTEAYQRKLLNSPELAAALRDQDKGATAEIRRKGANKVRNLQEKLWNETR